ncbi:uracil permease UraA [Gottschalkia acidurici 9a]|uniref:Uracil permease UraA n=1 Tax=Gottschalkia acidurici (strain ATCC 7906 / DSM 604 / BCRC 14475 / CIP 104303 / KCTC 5404 / NCIMB 10678 / 9a) TaxID=1128398 RepID=K0B170_GOTA9|nr:uracil-xanthine permease family protein [Gottschalkia acidurici]AFS78700.1 uracil permease UraA [Gottschalkia acidurici 9a]
MSKIEKVKRLVLGIQHVIAMFGATVLVPILTGLDPSIALITAGIGTLIFHLCTKRKVPVFVGSSFAFITVIQVVASQFGDLRYAQGGIIVAGLLYILLSFIVMIFGVNRVKSFFPPVVTGPMIMVIGLSLSPVALSMASKNWLVSFVVIVTVAITSIFARGFLKIIPILVGVIVGYGLSAALNLIDYAPIVQAKMFSLANFTLPIFDIGAIAIIAPVVLATFMEHIGDITTNGAVVGKNFYEDPGLHRTLMGDGLATTFAGLIGGPANTTYGENTSVLAVTKVYDPSILRLAAMIAVILGFLGKFGAILQTIPEPVMGGVSVVLFSMITSVGMRTIASSDIDFTDNRNLLISGLILIIGIGSEILKVDPNFQGVVGIQFGQNISITGVSLAALVGIIVNKLLPETKKIDVKNMD